MVPWDRGAGAIDGDMLISAGCDTCFCTQEKVWRFGDEWAEWSADKDGFGDDSDGARCRDMFVFYAKFAGREIVRYVETRGSGAIIGPCLFFDG